MNDFKLFNFSGQILISKQFGKFKVQPSSSADKPPTLPEVMVNYTFTKAQFPVEIQGKNLTLKFTEVK